MPADQKKPDPEPSTRDMDIAREVIAFDRGPRAVALALARSREAGVEAGALAERERGDRLAVENTRLQEKRDGEWAAAIREAANCVAPRPAKSGFRVHNPADRPRCGCSSLRALLGSPSDVRAASDDSANRQPASDEPARPAPPNTPTSSIRERGKGT